MTESLWKEESKKLTLPEGYSANEIWSDYNGEIYKYTSKSDPTKQYYIVWSKEDRVFYDLLTNDTWSVIERYDYKSIKGWMTGEASAKTVNIEKIFSDRKTLNPERLKSVKNAITEGRYLPPIKVSATTDGNYVILDGNHRLQAAKELGLTDIPYEIH